MISTFLACTTTTVVQQPPAASGGDAGEPEAPATPAPMKLTSSAYEEGGVFPEANTCDGDETKNPPLAWTAGPDGTLSYALIFTDKTNGLVHSAMYDIPASTLALKEGVDYAYEPSEPAGSKTSLNYKSVNGYIGPCPPTGEHTYEMAIYALAVEKLEGLTKSSSAASVETAAKKQDLAVAKLTAKYKKKS